MVCWVNSIFFFSLFRPSSVTSPNDSKCVNALFCLSNSSSKYAIFFSVTELNLGKLYGVSLLSSTSSKSFSKIEFIKSKLSSIFSLLCPKSRRFFLVALSKGISNTSSFGVSCFFSTTSIKGSVLSAFSLCFFLLFPGSIISGIKTFFILFGLGSPIIILLYTI